MSARLCRKVRTVKIQNKDAHAKYNQSRRGCESRVGKYLKIILSRHLSSERDGSQIQRQPITFGETLSISPSVG